MTPCSSFWEVRIRLAIECMSVYETQTAEVPFLFDMWKILKCHRAGMHRRGLWGLFKGLLVWQREDNSLMIFKCSDYFTYTYTPCLHQVHRMKLLAQSLSIFASFNKNPLCCVFSYYTPTLRKISEFFSLWRPRWRRKWKVMELKTF